MPVNVICRKTNQAVILFGLMVDRGYPYWMADVYSECFDSELSELLDKISYLKNPAFTGWVSIPEMGIKIG